MRPVTLPLAERVVRRAWRDERGAWVAAASATDPTPRAGPHYRDAAFALCLAGLRGLAAAAAFSRLTAVSSPVPDQSIWKQP